PVRQLAGRQLTIRDCATKQTAKMAGGRQHHMRSRQGGPMTPLEQLDEWRTMAQDCANRVNKLTEWEAGFIASIQPRLKQGFRLSDKQAETLNEIWDRVT
ncbi:hypothetical protein ACXWPN_09235, partial [Streptococcus pyogenes]